MVVLDNQGGWLPSSKLVHITQDRFFSHSTNPSGPFDAKPVTRPVLWLPQNEIANSPSNPLQLEESRFAGQMLFGDVTYGGTQRAYLEKVDDECQGAVFRFTQGLEAGVNRISAGPDGAICASGLGAGGNWGQEGKLTGGAGFDTEHAGYSGGGFVDNFGQQGASVAFDVETAKAGKHDVGLCHSNGPGSGHQYGERPRQQREGPADQAALHH